VMAGMPQSRRRALASALAAFAKAAGQQPDDDEAYLLGLSS